MKERASVTLVVGPPEARTIVVVPPLGMPAGLMRPFVQLLATSLRVVTIELPGAGRASAATPTTTRAQAAILADAMREHCPSPSHLFGISYGSMVSTWAAIDAPTLVDHLVLASSAARGRDAIVAEPGDKLALFEQAIGRGTPRVALAEAIAADVPAKEAARIEGVIEAAPRSDVELLWLVAAVATHDASSELGSIRAPTLVLGGDDDPIVPPALQDELARGIAGAVRQTIAHAGHAITLDQPEACARAVLAFVRR